MRIGIISDIHDHLHNLRPAIAYLTGKTDLLICCGDLCSPFVMDELRKYPGPVHIVFGNNDADLFRITRKSDARLQVHGEFLELNLDGFKIAANHFDNIANPIARSGLYQLVCFGHNHRFSLERFDKTVALNPGTLMGTAFGAGGSEPVPVTFATFDTGTGQPALYRLSGDAIELSTWERPGS
jgi:putative phosphoesterase